MKSDDPQYFSFGQVWFKIPFSENTTLNNDLIHILNMCIGFFVEYAHAYSTVLNSTFNIHDCLILLKENA